MVKKKVEMDAVSLGCCFFFVFSVAPPIADLSRASCVTIIKRI
jgi:hypothetical protein